MNERDMWAGFASHRTSDAVEHHRFDENFNETQRGDTFADAFAKARLTLDFQPNEPGKEVKSITFRSAAPIVRL